MLNRSLSRWEHECKVGGVTLDLLFQRQHATLKGMILRDASDLSRGISPRSVARLESIAVARVNIAYDPSFLHMTMANLGVVRRLHLGTDAHLASVYASRGELEDETEYRKSISAEILRGFVNHASTINNHPSALAPEELVFCCLDASTFFKDSFRPSLTFKGLKILRLESCIGAGEAMQKLPSADSSSVGQSFGCQNLESVVIRAEDVNSAFMESLEAFLMGLKPLRKLHLLLEGECVATIQGFDLVLHCYLVTRKDMIRDAVANLAIIDPVF